MRMFFGGYVGVMALHFAVMPMRGVSFEMNLGVAFVACILGGMATWSLFAPLIRQSVK